MWQYVIKVAITAVIVVLVGIVSRKSSLLGGILVSLPLTSILAMLWLWHDTRDKAKVAALSTSVFYLVIPSLVLFIALPLLLKRLEFGWALTFSCLLTIAAYYLMLFLLGILGIRL